MITVNDFVHLPFTSDLTEGGIAYALRTLPYTFDRTGNSPYEKLRRVVANAAVELAFRRHLSGLEIPYEVKNPTPFAGPERYDVSLGGHRCAMQSFLISHRGQISEIHRDPDVLLNAPALVPSDQHAGDAHSDHDLYLFAFLCGLTAASQGDIKKAMETGQPHYLLHVMDEEWRKPFHWNPLGPLTLRSESEEQMLIEINGQDAGREFLTRTVSLPPKTKVVLQDPFYSITSVHVRRSPAARVAIHSPACKETYVIGQMDWGNIWVYGMDIYLAGYISRDEFRRCAAVIAPNSRVFQYNRTHLKNLAVPVSELRPLGGLFEKVKEWEKGNNT
jgi:hypothetical protein